MRPVAWKGKLNYIEKQRGKVDDKISKIGLENDETRKQTGT